ncbi:MAG: carbohydrate-binding family 9-like protein [Tepidisphaeraceae bacterium]
MPDFAPQPITAGDWSVMRPIVPRNYVCPFINGPVALTGRGDDPAWEGAPWTDDFVDIEGDRRPAPRFRTRAKMLWTATHFHVLADLEEPHVWASITTRNQVIFHDNDFEIFLDPDGDHHRYYEFEVNAHNTAWELSLPRPYRDGGVPIDPDNRPGLRSAVWVDGTLNDPRDTDRGWRVEVAIPWPGFAPFAGGRSLPPRDGDQWRINFSRVQWLADIVDGQYRKVPKSTRDEDNWVWSPQGVIDMHRPERWGYVQFSASPATTVFRPDPTAGTRDRLMDVYYRQRHYREQLGRYATELASLGLDDRDIHLKATSDGYTASIEQGPLLRLSVDQHSRIIVEG